MTVRNSTPERPWAVRIAEESDIPAIRTLMDRAIRELMRGFLAPEEIDASFEIMGLDTQLITDGTYFVIEAGGRLVGCGGWSARATLYGGDHTEGRSDAMLDPARDAARVRAMYTDPMRARQGIGRAILAACERAAASAGFSRAELMATMAGVPLYGACGYAPVERTTAMSSKGVQIPLVRMGKTLRATFKD
jgi:GNAT superfamily N-acetyltransferase